MHGMSKTVTYKTYQRIFRTKNICDSWRGELDGFLNFVKDMGRPLEGQSLLLKAGETIYGPQSCEWGIHTPVALPLEFIVLEVNYEARGVYKLTFSNGEFYIGSTAHFGDRIVVFKTEIRKGYAHNKRMKNAISESKQAVFEVIEYVYSEDHVRDREDFYIKSAWGNSLLLNRSPSAFSNKGCKWTVEERRLMSAATKGKPRSGRPRKYPKTEYIKRGPKFIPVAAFDLNGSPLGTFISIKAAAIHFGVPREKICMVANNNARHVKGFVFKRIDSIPG